MNGTNSILIRDPEDLVSFEHYLSKMRELSPKTVMCYLKWYKNLDPTLIDSQEYIDAFLNQYGNNCVIRGMLKNYLEFRGVQRLIFLPSPPKSRKAKRIIRDLTVEQMKEYIEIAKAIDFKKGLIVEIAYYGALRLFEIPTISLSSFKILEWKKNPEKSCELIVHGKGKKQRTVLIPSETMQDILTHLLNKGFTEEQIINSKSPFFIRQDGNVMTEKNVYDVIKKTSKAIVGRDVRPHELRHARATHLDRMGVLAKNIKNYLGHSNLATTEIYLHSSEQESIDAIREFVE